MARAPGMGSGGIDMRVFISHASDDDGKLRALTRALKKAKPSFIPVVVAARREPGRLLADKVMDCIQQADFLVPILTRSSRSNQWVNQEIGYAQGIKRRIVPVVEREIISELKGFVHDQHDLPFSFPGYPENARREAAAFRSAYKPLIRFLQSQRRKLFESSISPARVASGDVYTTNVAFSGSVLNGFFDNYVVHLESNFRTWNWDPETIPPEPGHRVPSNTTPGVLNGVLDITKSYSYATKGWPMGKYKIYVRLYSHPTPGAPGRSAVAENEHDFEVY